MCHKVRQEWDTTKQKDRQTKETGRSATKQKNDEAINVTEQNSQQIVDKKTGEMAPGVREKTEQTRDFLAPEKTEDAVDVTKQKLAFMTKHGRSGPVDTLKELVSHNEKLITQIFAWYTR
jgi:hypothetical protein